MIALRGALIIAAVTTFGDFIWAGLHLRHRVVYGLAHGTLLFLCIGLFLGWSFRRTAAGGAAGAIIGFVGAGSFYVLASIGGYFMMFLVWAFLWLALAYLPGRLLRKPPLSWSAVLARGVIAAIGSSIGFYLISGIWRPFNPHGWDYAVHYLSWVFAFLPGFAAITFRIRGQTPLLQTVDL